VILHLKRLAFVKLCQIVGDELNFYLAYLFRSWQSTRFAK
jgi:hypothetical protein